MTVKCYPSEKWRDREKEERKEQIWTVETDIISSDQIFEFVSIVFVAF